MCTPPKTNTGLSALELSKLLTSAFGLGGAACVVGFQDEQGVVIPISLASSSAAAGALLLAPGAVYRLLLTDTEDFLLPPAGAHQQPHHQQQQQQGTVSEAGGGGITPLQPPPPFVAGAHAHSPVGVTPTSSSASSVPMLPAGGVVRQQQEQRSQPASVHAWQEPLSRFVGVLGEQGVLAPEERAVLRALVEEGDIALAAAYRVAAARGGNRELLAAVCKRVAQGVFAAEGPAAGGGGESVLEEQGEMLQMLGHVVEEGLVTPEQHLQLVRLRFSFIVPHCVVVGSSLSLTRFGRQPNPLHRSASSSSATSGSTGSSTPTPRRATPTPSATPWPRWATGPRR